MTCCFSAYLSSSHRTASGAKYWTIRALLYCNDYFVLGGICTCLGVVSVPYVRGDFFEFLSTEFAACSKPPSSDKIRKVSYLRTQKRTQVIQRELS